MTMRIAIISDIHLGDTKSVMAFRDEISKEITVGSKYEEFVNIIREKTNKNPLDFLILAGDILDFSISSYSNSYEIGRVFFQRLKKDDIARELIYMPGNHDYDLWHTVEYQTNITNCLNQGKMPKPFRHSVPGIIDDREGVLTRGFTLHNVTAKTEKNKPKYAGLFLDNITDPATPFNFVCPNIYLVTPDETVIITHGQYLDEYWSALGKWCLTIINGDMELKDPKLYDMHEMMAVNFPTCQLNSSGLGQSGPLTDVIQKLMHGIKEQYFTQVNTYLDRMDLEIKQRFKGITRFFLRLAFKLARHELLKALDRRKSSRFREDFLKDQAVCARARSYYASSVFEISEINIKYGSDIPLPTRMIMGHTHIPIPWGSDKAPVLEMPQLPEGKVLAIYNTGGWLTKMDKSNLPQFCGAEIFFYETGQGISSVSIRDPNNIQKTNK